MEAGKRRSHRDYTLTFKLSVVDQVETASWAVNRLKSATGFKAKLPF